MRDAFAAQLAGVFAPFKDFAGHHLARRIAASNKDTTTTTSEEAAAKVVQAWTSSAEPYPDISYGITALQSAGMKIAVLTNGSVNIARAVLEKAGLLSEETNTTSTAGAGASGASTKITTNKHISIFDINETLAWKPAKESYQFVCSTLAFPPSEVLMVASHPWDCHGALQAGMKAAYVQRDPHQPYPEFLDQPQTVVTDFTELAETLL